VTNDASVERGCGGRRHQSRSHRRRHQQRRLFPLGGWQRLSPTEQAQHLVDTNFFGSVRVNRAVLPHMRRQTQRRAHAHQQRRWTHRLLLPWVSIAPPNFALEALAESYHYELAGQGIESVIVEPGAYETPVFRQYRDGCRRRPAPIRMVPSSRPLQNSTRHFPPRPAMLRKVADAVLRIIETPAGEKQMRYLVSPRKSRRRSDQRPLKASASQPARRLRHRCRHQVPQR